jgi:3-oxoacyl-[acyl-carrier protein] reductase
MSMQDRGAIVTGGAKGIGFAIAKALAARGARLALVDKDADTLSAAVETLNADGGTVTGVVGDVTRQATCRQAFEEAARACGRVDVLVNNAGIYIRTPIEEIDDDEWDLIFDVCLRGLFHMSVAAARHMRAEGGGRIVNIASVDGYVAFPAMVHYAAAKAGVISLTKSFAIAYAGDGILVNGVAPGAINTPPMRIEGHIQKMADSIPLGRGGEPKEIAEAVCFLASDANTYMTGEVMVVSGGLVIV